MLALYFPTYNEAPQFHKLYTKLQSRLAQDPRSFQDVHAWREVYRGRPQASIHAECVQRTPKLRALTTVEYQSTSRLLSAVSESN